MNQFLLCKETHHPRKKKKSRRLKDSKEVKRIVKMIDQVKVLEGEDVPFIFLEGSSGMGKTQCALAIRQKLLEQKRIVHYFLAKSSTSKSQDVYKAFREISAAFHQKCVKRDYKKNDEFHCA